MAIYILSGVTLLLVLISGICFCGVWKAVRMQDYAEKERHYLEKALKARGLWDDFQLASRDALLLWSIEEQEQATKKDSR
jgi:hypothetical protein